MKNFKIAKFVFIGLILFIASLPYAYASNAKMSCYDTISGLNTFLEIKSDGNENGLITITKPDQNKVVFLETTDENGYIYSDIDAFHLKQSGRYEASYQDIAYNKYLTCGFQVYSGEPDYKNSQLEIEGSKIALANAKDSITVKVNLKDVNNNPVSGYSLTLISSKKEDKIDLIDYATNDNGVLEANISSVKAGKSTISIFDPQQNAVLDERIDIVFIEDQANNVASQIETGGYFGYASLFDLVKAAQDYGSSTKFKIEGLENDVKVGEAVNLTVTVNDQSDNTVLNYIGSILFSTTDESAVIPKDPYKFKEEDLGTHTFNLAFKFYTAGKQTVTVNDVDNYDLRNSVEFNVIDNKNADNTNSGVDSQNSSIVLKIDLTTPKAGTYNDSITFSGIGPANANLQIYGNNDLWDKVTTDQKGNFNKTITNLETGLYTVYVANLDKSGNIVAQSDSVNLKVDTDAAQVEQISIEPPSIMPNSQIFVTLLSKPNLAQVSVIIDDKIVDLAEDAEHTGKYSGKLQAPVTSGDYMLDAVLVNELGAEAIYPEAASFQVQESQTTSSIDNDSTDTDLIDNQDTTAIISDADTDTTQITDQIPLIYPSQVTGLEVTSVEADKITLSWEVSSISDENKFIKNYRIYYGTDPQNLNNIVNTFDSSTKWYIPNLSNNATYYFQITAIDSVDLESQMPSQMVSAMTTTVASGSNGSTEVLHGSAEDINAIDDSQLDNIQPVDFQAQGVKDNPESGPSTLFILLTTLILTDIYIRVRKSRHS